MMRLNWHSPLPPARSGIADLTAAVAPDLARRFSVRYSEGRGAFFRTPDSTADPVLEPPDACEASTLNVYHLGNDLRYHLAIYGLACARPGVVVLHDANMVEFFSEMLKGVDLTRAFPSAEAPDAELCVSLLNASRSGLRPVGGARTYAPILRLALANALCAVGFSEEACEALRLADACPVFRAELPAKVAARSDALRAEPGRMVLFGHLGDNRRLFEVLLAIATHPRRQDLRLDIFGSHPAPGALEALLESFGLGDRVAYRGFAGDEVLDAAITRAVLVVNLRFPSMGEASGSQLRTWALGRTSVVTPVAWYASIPDGLVLTAPIEREQDALHAAFDRALDDPSGLLEMGEAGRRHVERTHDPRSFVDLLSRIAWERDRCSARWRVERYIERSAIAAAPWRGVVGDGPLTNAADAIIELSAGRAAES